MQEDMDDMIHAWLTLPLDILLSRVDPNKYENIYRIQKIYTCHIHEAENALYDTLQLGRFIILEGPNWESKGMGIWDEPILWVHIQ